MVWVWIQHLSSKGCTAPQKILWYGSLLPRKALRTLNQKSFWKISSTFGDKCPQNGSKNGLRAPRTGMGCPHIGPSVVPSQQHLTSSQQQRGLPYPKIFNPVKPLDESCTLNPQPSTLNPQPSTLNLKPQNPSTLNPEPQTANPFNPEP